MHCMSKICDIVHLYYFGWHIIKVGSFKRKRKKRKKTTLNTFLRYEF